MKLYQLGTYRADDDADPVKRFGPLFTDSEDDRDTMRQVIDGFNEDAAKGGGGWCMAVFPAKMEAVAK